MDKWMQLKVAILAEDGDIINKPEWINKSLLN